MVSLTQSPIKPNRVREAYILKASDVAEMAFLKNPYKIPKFGGKSQKIGGKSYYLQKIGGDDIPSIPRF